ncbi:protein qui-1 isoform X1 [Hetaerina americana]|uniref:protein qui-1 isoform X1 n=1 Tax=Hetaerina americana TaxID=62018 RepID=UPI003A7F0FDB
MEVEEMLQEVLRGSLKASRWPAPRVVKIFVASTRNDLAEERRQLLEVIGPELQAEYEHTGIEVEFVDMHYGVGYDITLDGQLFADHLNEISECRRYSKGCFFICLVGDEYLPRPLPAKLLSSDVAAMKEAAKELNISDAEELLSAWYIPLEAEDGSKYHTLRRPKPNPEVSDEAATEWTATKESIENILVSGAKHLIEKADQRQDVKAANQLRHTFLHSAVEQQFSHAISISPSATKPAILAVVRDFENGPPSPAEEPNSLQKANRALLKSFRDRIGATLPSENRLYLTAKWKSGGIDPESEEHEMYLYRFRCSLKEHLRVMISKALDEDPDMKGRNKTIMEVFEEAACHLAMSREHLKECNGRWAGTPELEQLKATLVGAANAAPTIRHAPILLHGPPGSGKSSLLSSIAQSAEEWFASDESTPQPHRQLLRVVRFCGATPRSAYSLEVLRLLCQHLAILLHTEFLPKDASFDPLYLNTWFQSLVRRAETAAQTQPQWPPPLLLILLDDLHGLQPTESDIVAALSWLPVSLPPNVLLVATSALHPDALKLTPLQKERLGAPESLFQLTGCAPLRTRLLSFLSLIKIKKLGDLEENEEVEEGASLEKLSLACLHAMEQLVCRPAIARLASLLSATQFGLTETEILELTMPTNRGEDDPLRLANANFTFSSLCSVRRTMNLLLKERVQSGRIVIGWRHQLISEVSARRYLATPESQKSLHAELAALFFQEDDDEDDDEDGDDDEDAEEEKKERKDQEEGDEEGKRKETPFQATAAPDVTYSTRHVEESWIHLLKADDADRLKKLTVCNFDFLLATVQTASISYLRCVLEHARCHHLDRHLELVYGAVRKSSDVLSRDPLQLASQIICWLRPVAEGSGDLVGAMIMSAMAWCDGYSEPLLVPLTAWLQPPLPLQIKGFQMPSPVRLMEATPSGQNIVIISWASPNEPQLWSTPSGTLIHSFRPGHSGPIVCLSLCPVVQPPANPESSDANAPSPPTSSLSSESQYLITGSEDTSVMVWDLSTMRLKLRIMEHIAPVLCVTSALGNTVVASGGEDSRVILTSLVTGEVIMRIDHHRGPVTAVAVNSSDDVLVSGSSDSTICIWSLDDFVLLNTIQLQSPIARVCISPNSSFLLAATDQHRLCLRSLATGSQIHYLKGLKADVCSMSIAQDSQRAAVGSSDGRVYVFDMLGGCLSRTLSSHPAAPVTGVSPTAHDDFLLSAGGNKISVWSFRPRDGLPNMGTPLGVFSAAARGGLGGVAADTENQNARTGKAAMAAQRPHDAPITCVDISRDGTMAVTGSVDCLVNVWSVRTTPEVHCTLEGHTAPVSVVAFAPSGLFAVSGSEDRTARVWGLTLGLLVSCFRGHGSTITSVAVMMDSRRVATSDRSGVLMVWAADSGALLLSLTGMVPGVTSPNPVSSAPGVTNVPKLQLAVTSDMRYAVSGSGDNSLRISRLTKEKEERDVTVSHSEEITCFVLTADSRHVITGSKDSSLKVWQVAGGKLAQVLVGHSDHVTCVAVSIQPPPSLVPDSSRPPGLLPRGLPTNIPVAPATIGEKVAPPEAPPPVLVVSGARDASLIVWDMATGADLRTLSGHLAFITCVAVAADGTIAVSGSEDKSVMVWDTRRGLPLSSLSMHAPILGLCMSTDAARIVLHLQDCAAVPVACLHNTPATYVKLPAYVQPAKEIEDLRPSAPKRPMRRLLKKEVSLDTYTWQKKYGHLTSSAMVAAVEERLKRRFSVSASMEEISKIPGSTMGSQICGPEQAALAQSQHFEHLQALWNKRSPPRRRQNPSLSKQNSCSSRRDSADPGEDDGMEEEDEEEAEEESEKNNKRQGIPTGPSDRVYV